MENEYTFDELLDITAEYLDTIDLSVYFNIEETDVQDVQDRLLADFSAGKLPALPESLDGNIFKVFDLWDFAVYLRNKYNLVLDEEVSYRYWISPKSN